MARRVRVPGRRAAAPPAEDLSPLARRIRDLRQAGRRISAGFVLFMVGEILRAAWVPPAAVVAGAVLVVAAFLLVWSGAEGALDAAAGAFDLLAGESKGEDGPLSTGRPR